LSAASKMRILVLDDEKFVADSLAMILEGEGHDALAVYDGIEALKRSEFFIPDCVISDVIMPGMNGIEFCSAIEKTYPNCQILLFSGQASTGELLESARADGHHWEILAKPIDPEELLAKVESLLNK
jgi:CheY-like chemotaxis protein